jgi:carbon storage regulator CsrA
MRHLKLNREDPIDVGRATIHLLEVQGNQVRIGIKAPKSVKIRQRKENKRPAGRNKTLTELLV